MTPESAPTSCAWMAAQRGNDFLCQFQADILGIPVERPATTESTALGAAYLAGLATGFWKDEKELAAQLKIAKRFEPIMPAARRDELYAG